MYRPGYWSRRRPLAEFRGDFQAAVCRGRIDPRPISASTKCCVNADVIPRPVDVFQTNPHAATMLVALALPCPGLMSDALSGHGARNCVEQRALAPNAIYCERNGASHRCREGTFSRQQPAASAAPLTTFGSKVSGIGRQPSLFYTSHESNDGVS